MFTYRWVLYTTALQKCAEVKPSTRKQTYGVSDAYFTRCAQGGYALKGLMKRILNIRYASLRAQGYLRNTLVSSTKSIRCATLRILIKGHLLRNSSINRQSKIGLKSSSLSYQAMRVGTWGYRHHLWGAKGWQKEIFYKAFKILGILREKFRLRNLSWITRARIIEVKLLMWMRIK